MSVSIYYTAKREKSITKEEKQTIDRLIEEYSAEKEIREYMETGKGVNWEEFSVYELDNDSDIIFEGATRLPNNSKEAMWEGVQHWNLLLSTIRCVIPDAQWYVNVDNYELVWDDEYSEYNLSK